MKDFLLKASATTVIAIILLLSCMGIMSYMVVTSNPHDATSRTQIIQGLFGLLMMMGGYYFGAAKNRTASTGTGDVTVNNATPDNTAT